MMWLPILACANPEGGPTGTPRDDLPEAAGGTGAGTGTDGDTPDDPSEEVFAEGVIHDIDLVIDDTAWKLLGSGTDAVAEVTMTIDGETFDVGIHRKGSSTLRGMGQKAAFSVDLAEYVADQRWHGLHHFALNNMVIDPTMVREHVAAWMYQQVGIVAARHSYARVSVNGEAWGLYGLVESADQRFLHSRWNGDDGGWMYDSTFNVSDLTPGAADSFTVQEDGDAGEAFADLAELVSAVSATSPSSSMSLFRDRFDADEFLRVQAGEIVLGNYDSYWFNRNNYLLYHAPAADRWHMIPWGPDQAFMGNGPIHDTPHGELGVLCSGDPECVAALDGHIREVAQAMLDLDLATYVEDTLAWVQPECDADPRREQRCDPSSIRNFVSVRPAYVLSQL